MQDYAASVRFAYCYKNIVHKKILPRDDRGSWNLPRSLSSPTSRHVTPRCIEELVKSPKNASIQDLSGVGINQY